jgi:hypothetical protein
LDVLQVFTKNLQMSDLMKILPEGPELLHADRWTGRYDEANSCSSPFAKGSENHRYGILIYPSIFKITPLHVLVLVSVSPLNGFAQMKTFLKPAINLSNSYKFRVENS